MVGRKLSINNRPVIEKKEKEKVLEVKHLTRGNVLKDVSFHLNKGEILGIAGLMGAGRTEIVRALFGADRMDSGEIFVNGKKVNIKNPTDAVNYGIGYLSEDRKYLGLMVDMDVKTNIAIASMHKFKRLFLFSDEKEIETYASNTVQKLRIKTPSVNQKVKFLSGGNQQKVVIGKWLTRDCDILIFDEPTRGIDVGAKGEIYALLQQLVEQGKSIIMVSSELQEVLSTCHRVITVCEGQVTGDMINENLTQEMIMTHATSRIIS